MSIRPRRAANAIMNVLLALEGAHEASIAVHNRRRPTAQSLEKLGIDPQVVSGLKF